jgi:hypothetical protein
VKRTFSAVSCLLEEQITSNLSGKYSGSFPDFNNYINNEPVAGAGIREPVHCHTVLPDNKKVYLE